MQRAHYEVAGDEGASRPAQGEDAVSGDSPNALHSPHSMAEAVVISEFDDPLTEEAGYGYGV
jgi:hypothetical protein